MANEDPKSKINVENVLAKFFSHLKSVLEASNTDVTAIDDYEVEKGFVMFIISDYFKDRGEAVSSIENIEVYEGPQVSSISSNMSVRFDYSLEKHKGEHLRMNLFLKVPPYGGYASKQCSIALNAKENQVYSELFGDFHKFLGTPVKPYVPCIPELVYAHSDYKVPENNLLGQLNQNAVQR